MHLKLTGLALAVAAVMAGGARAQVIDDPQANVVEALVVSAKLPGPAWWRVTDADTTIYVLGAPNALPKGMAWDKSVLEHRLDGAFAVITPPEWRAGLTDLPGLLKLRKRLKGTTPGPNARRPWRRACDAPGPRPIPRIPTAGRTGSR